MRWQQGARLLAWIRSAPVRAIIARMQRTSLKRVALIALTCYGALQMGTIAVLSAIALQRNKRLETARFPHLSLPDVFVEDNQLKIFTYGTNLFNAMLEAIASAQEQYQAALARTEVTKQQIIQQVFSAYYTLRTSTDRVRTARDLVASATQSETVARERYREGVGSIVDLLVAQSALASARAQDVDARWQWRSSLAQLAHDVGVLDARGDTSFSLFTPVPDVRPDR